MQKLVLPITLLALAPIVAASWVGANILLNYMGSTKQLFAHDDRKSQTKYGRFERNVYEHCGGVDDRKGMYHALFDRANEEVSLANDAWRAFDDDRARWHAQRASDYKFAAQCYCETGKFPPGFDSDLATK
jgi:hypothetical protein